MADKLGVIALLVALLMLGAPLLAVVRRRRPARPALGLIAVLLLLSLGELILLWRHAVLGALLFIAGTTLFLLVAPRSQSEPQLSEGRPYQRLLLGMLVVGVLGVGIGLRFWRLNDVPYGIEQDEMAWTVGAAHATYSDMYDEVSVQTYSFQRELLPVSSFQERLFFDRFGMSLETARLENAVFSTAAIVLFYLLVLQFARHPAALIATFLLSISTLHVASARQAHVESHVLFWVMLSYLLFWLSVRHRSALLSAATGISVVIGVWTYETYNMTVVVIITSFAIFAVLDLKHWRAHAVNVGLFLLPIALIARQEFDHAQSRRSYQFEKFDSFRSSLHGPVWQQGWDWIAYLSDNLRTLFENVFVHQTHPAFEFPMVRPDAPMVLAVSLPLAALGLLLVLRNPWRKESTFLLLWVAFQLLAVPALLGIGWGRVLLPAVPALFVLAGLGGAYALRGLSEAYARQGWATIGVVLLLAGTLAGLGARAYFYELQDPEDRRIRREVVDTIAAQRDSSAYILLPSRADLTPREGLLRPSPADMRFLIGMPPDIAAAEQRFRYVNINKLLEGVQEPRPIDLPPGPLLIMMPHRNQDPRLPVPPEEAGIRSCYDVKAVSVGKYVDMLEISQESLASPHCEA